MKEKSCGAIIYRYIDEELQFLVLQQKAGHWSLPKGHMEKGETEEETALREIREETGLEVILDNRFREVIFYPVKNGNIKDVVYFVAEVSGGHVQAQISEINEILWLTKTEARNRLTFDNTIEVFDKAVLYIEGL